jgi:hypothetical protein
MCIQGEKELRKANVRFDKKKEIRLTKGIFLMTTFKLNVVFTS